ncbi:MAG: hypothetical protein ABIW38_08905 [Ferruginibacter sp.]
MERSYKYLGYFFLLLIPLIFAGFYKTYIIQFPAFDKIKHNYIHIHAALAIVWVSLLIIQPFLIANKKLAWHRKLGKLSYIIFPLFILSFIPSIINNLRSDTPGNAFFPIGDSSLLILFYSLAIYYRKKSPVHMRYMICAAMVLLGPTIGRILPIYFGLSEVPAQSIQFAVIQLILIILIMTDIRSNKNNTINKKKKYKPYLVAMAGWCVHQAVFFSLFL